MKLRSKLSITIIPIILLAIISLNIAFGIFFQSFVLEQEDSQIQLARENISSYVQERRNKYIASANDWGHWDDTFWFIGGNNEAYVQANLTEDTFANLDLSFMIYADLQDAIVYQQYYSLEDKKFAVFPAGFFESFSNILRYAKGQDDTFGIYQLGDRFYFFAATDITDSVMKKQPAGKMIIGRHVDESILRDMEKISGCTISSIQMTQAADVNATDDVVLNYIRRAEGPGPVLIELSIPNSNGMQSTAILTLSMPRKLYLSGMERVFAFGGMNTVFSVFASVLIFLLLGKYLTKPFMALINDVRGIDMAKREFVKLPESGQGEFSYLRKVINHLLGKIELEHQETVSQHEKLQATLLSVGDGVISVDNDGRIQFLNPAAQKLTGWTMEDAQNIPIDRVFVIINEYTRQPVESPVKLVFDTEEVVELANHTLLLSKDGNEVPIEDTAAPIKDAHGKTIGCVLVFRDFSERKEKQRRIEFLSYHDQLTGLYNRRFFDEELKRIDIVENLPLSFVYADVNGLKPMNDAFGHQSGDQMIQMIAEVLQKECRSGDIIARTGGDEFVLLLPKTDESTVEKLLSGMKAKVEMVKFMDISMSISFGWNTKTAQEQSARDLLKRAEDFMYQKKIFHSSTKRNATINSILQALYEKNVDEKQHSLGVGEICEAIGKAYGLENNELWELRTAGEMHDMGKIAVDKMVLDKESPLSESDWAQIKRHPEIGYRLLSTSNEFYQISEHVLFQHERWDGHGYPRGLQGEAIPWKARVIAVADAFDAMMHDRPYRKAFSLEKAVEEIKKNAGTQFDPEIARAFVEKVLGLPW